MADLKAEFSSRQTAVNYLSSGVAFTVSLAIGFWFTPYLVNSIGPAHYGLVILSATLISYAAPLAQSLATTFSRAFSVAIQVGDIERTQRLMDDAMGLSLKLVVIAAACLVPLAIASPYLLGTSPGYRFDQSVVLLLTVAAFLIWMVSSPLAALVYAANRIDYGIYAQTTQNIVRIIAAVILIEALGWGIYAAPAGGIAGAMAALAGMLLATMAVAPVRVRYAGVDTNTQLARMGGAVLFGTVGSMLLLSTELLVVNYMTDEVSAGLYAASIQIPALIRTTMLTLGAVFGPTILALYAKGDIAASRAATGNAVKTVGLIAALPAGIVFATAPLILELWLGKAFVPYAAVLQLGMVASVAHVVPKPMHDLALATGRLWFPAVLRVGALIFYLLLALVLFKTTSLGLTSVALALAIGMAAPELLLMAPFVSRAAQGSALYFLKPVAIVVAAIGACWAICRAMLLWWTPATLTELCLFCAAVAPLYGAVALVLAGSRQRTALVAVMAASARLVPGRVSRR